ncbi:MAG: sigma-70 family RNA polymerase sigma factor [Actinobacteria bacterium]|nr:sigma-70 family RNA polymerase sigma factor [Actinomycetota bacterium]
MVSAVSFEAELVARCGAGDERAIAALYDRFGRAAFVLARRVTRDDSMAEDVVQDAFLDVWRAAARFDPERAAVSTWLFTFVHRRAIDAVRRASVRPRPYPGDVDALPEPVDPVDVAVAVQSGEEAARVQHALGKLPERERRVLELAYVRGLSQSEVAAELGAPLGTVKSRTHTALAHMRQLLSEAAT